MTKNGARHVILAYLSTSGIGPGGQTTRSDLQIWCVKNQHRYGATIQPGTYLQQVGQMIMGNAKNLGEGHSDGLDDVFCSSSKGNSVLTVYNPKK
jgi:streptogramin lyase